MIFYEIVSTSFFFLRKFKDVSLENLYVERKGVQGMTPKGVKNHTLYGRTNCIAYINSIFEARTSLRKRKTGS